MKDLIVVILSDQTIPNVLFIKEFCKKPEDEILFISSHKIQKEGKDQWIKKAVNIKNKIHTIEVDFNGKDIQEKLESSDIDFDEFDKKLVNITGGTKLMSLKCYIFFRERGFEIFYNPNAQEYLKIFPTTKNNQFKFTSKLNVKEYFDAYGYDSKHNTITQEPAYTQRFFDWFLNKGNDFYHVIKKLQEKRNELSKKKNKNILISEVEGLELLLKEIDFPISEENKISKKEIEYLTGNWLEEYVYNKLKSTGLTDDEIRIGVSRKNENTENELDVVYIKDNVLHVVECKTYIVSKEKTSLPNDTIYKLDSILKELGLFPKSYIVTLNQENEISDTHKKRAKQYNISLISVEKLQESNFQNQYFHL